MATKPSAGLQAILDGQMRRKVVSDAHRDAIFHHGSPTMDTLFEVACERERQQAKHGRNSCANPALNNCFKLTVLIEEVGEVAEALQRPGQLSDTVRAHLRTELIQVAAVATAWAEALIPKQIEPKAK